MSGTSTATGTACSTCASNIHCSDAVRAGVSTAPVSRSRHARDRAVGRQRARARSPTRPDRPGAWQSRRAQAGDHQRPSVAFVRPSRTPSPTHPPRGRRSAGDSRRAATAPDWRAGPAAASRRRATSVGRRAMRPATARRRARPERGRLPAPASRSRRRDASASNGTGRRLSGSTRSNFQRLGALVGVGNAGRGQLQHGLRQRVAHAASCEPLGQRPQHAEHPRRDRPRRALRRTYDSWSPPRRPRSA